MWTIYSVGDLAFLQQVLQGVVMLCGADDWMAAARIATLIGVLSVFFRSLNRGGMSIDLKEPLIAMMIYLMACGTTTTVAIESIETGAVVTQAGVPLGMAAAGSIVSLLGMRLTELFEQAFATPQMLQNGFGSSLEAIKVVRINTMTVFGYGAANAPDSGADVYTSWVHYFTECTIPGLEKGRITANQLLSKTPFSAAVQLVTPVNGTEIYIGGAPTDTDCTNAYTQLLNYTTTRFVPLLLAQLSSPLGGAPNSTAAATTIITNALNGIGQGTVSVTDFIETGVLVPIFFDALSSSAGSTFASSYSTMVADGQRNRASQWLGQQSLFTSYIRPMMAFIEGFQFAIMPLALLAALLGGASFGLASKVLAGLVWIQLWYPLLAIVNLYEQMALTGEMTAMVGAGNALTSLAGTLQGDQSFLSWLAIGGMLATSVPALAGALAFGTYQGVAGLVGLGAGIGSSENLVPDVAAPREIGHQYSGISAAPLRQVDPTMGLRSTGSDAVVPSMTFTKVDAGRIESARNESDASVSDLRSVLSHSTGTGFSVDDRGGESSRVSRSNSTGTTESLASTLSDVASTVKRLSDDQGIHEDVGWKMAAGAALGYRKAGTGGSGGVDLSHMTGLTQQQRTAGEEAFTKTFSDQPQVQAQLLSSIAKDIVQNREHSVFASSNQSDQSAIQKSASRAVSAIESYQSAVSSSVSSGANQTVSSQAAVAAVLSNPEARAALTGAVVRFGLGGQAMAATNHNQEQWRRNYGGQAGAEVMGQFFALGAFNPASADHGGALLERGAVNSVLSTAIGGQFPTIGGASRNEGIGGGAKGPAGGAGGSGVRGAVQQGLHVAGQAVDGVTPETIGRQFDQNRAAQVERGAVLAAPVADAILAQNQKHAEADRTATTAERVHGVVQGLSDMGGDLVAAVTGGTSGVAAAGAARVDGYEHQAKHAGLTDVQARYYAHRAGGVDGPEVGEMSIGVRREAVGAGWSRSQADMLVERIDAAATGAGTPGADLRLSHIAADNLAHNMGGGEVSPSMRDALGKAVRRTGSDP